MISTLRSPARILSAVVSDVDGTLVTDDKRLTPRTIAAVAKLRADNIAFSIISSRPPRGLRMLIEPLGIAAPAAAFNGGAIVAPGLSIVAQTLLSPPTARQALELIEAHGVRVWMFCGQDWLAREAGAAYVALEEKTLGFPPTVVGDFACALGSAAKIVAVGDDFELLTRLEQEARGTLMDRATVARSQPYYVDFTPPLANKGVALLEIAKRLAVPTSEIAVIGDGGNDVAMFERSGLSIAMGNANPEVQHAADFVTDRNDRDGFAKAIEWIVLGGHRSNVSAASASAGSHADDTSTETGARA